MKNCISGLIDSTREVQQNKFINQINFQITANPSLSNTIYID